MVQIAKTEEKGGFYSALSGAGGFFGRVLLPLGLFAVLAVGLHVGSDKIDDHLFVIISWLDALFDGAAIVVIRAVGGIFTDSAQSIEVWTFKTIEWIDVDVKSELSRIGALVVELLADFVLALPVFFHRSAKVKFSELGTYFKKTFRDPTLLKLAAPVAVLAAGTAGTFAVSRELQVLTHSRLINLHVEPDIANFIASSIGFIALALVVWRVLIPLGIGAIEFADRRANNDTVLSVPPRTRRLRGLFTAFVAMPVALIALFATPVLGTLRALLWM
jgi:hypothetical protein